MSTYTWVHSTEFDGFAKIGQIHVNCRPFAGKVGSGRFRSHRDALADAGMRGSVALNGAYVLKRLPNGRGWRLVGEVPADGFAQVNVRVVPATPALRGGIEFNSRYGWDVSATPDEVVRGLPREHGYTARVLCYPEDEAVLVKAAIDAGWVHPHGVVLGHLK